MIKQCLTCVACLVLTCAEASWYWPFGDDGEKRSSGEPRVSELMEPASLLVDEASDLASEDKISEAVEKYRAALKELDRVAKENPDRIDKPEFATLKTKRAYINAAIDSLLLAQAKDNARPIGVSDTRELEQKLYEEEHPKPKTEEAVKPAPAAPAAKEEAEKTVKEPPAKKSAQKVAKKTVKKAAPARELTKNERIMKAIGEKNFSEAERLIAELLTTTPNSAVALNLRAAKETAQEKFRDAERTLDQAIQSHPRHAASYYNMAVLLLQSRPDDRAAARRYYETSLAFGGLADAELEAALK